jgi:hypothetical protein
VAMRHLLQCDGAVILCEHRCLIGERHLNRAHPAVRQDHGATFTMNFVIHPDPVNLCVFDKRRLQKQEAR